MQIKTGYQLIEMMIVISIISILAVTALPSYTQHLSRTHRLEAQHALLELAVKLENYQLQNNSDGGATFAALNISEFTNGRHYRLSIQTNEVGYLLSAMPQGNQRSSDECGTLTLNSVGQKGAGNVTRVRECWG